MTLEKPENGNNVQTYNVKVKVNKYQNKTSFKLVTGDAEKTIELLSGKENAVKVDPYITSASDRRDDWGDNAICGEYVPGVRGKGTYYCFTYSSLVNNITLYTSKANLRFCIYEEINGELERKYD